MTTKVASLDARRRGVGRLLRFCFGDNRNTNRVKNTELRWPELIERLRTAHVGAETFDEYMRLPVPEQVARKDVGYVMPCHMDGGVRGKSNVHLRSCLVLDVDHCPAGAIERICDSLLGLGRYEFVLHSTRKHKTEAPRLRLYVVLTRDVDAVEHGAIIRKIASDIQPVGDESSSLEWFDETGYEFTRVAFLPSVSKDQEYVFIHNEGEWLDPESILSTYTNYQDLNSWPVSEKLKSSVRLGTKRSGNPLEKPGLIGAFNRVYTIHEAMDEFIPGVYVPGAHDDRMSYAAGSSANGALIYDNGLFLFSRHETDPCYYQNCNAFDMVRIHLFGDLDSKVEAGTPINKLPSFKAMQQRAAEDPRVRAELLATRVAERAADFEDFDSEVAAEEGAGGLSVAANASDGADEATDGPPTVPRGTIDPSDGPKVDVEQQIRAAAAKGLHSDKGGLIACLATLEAIFEHDPRLKGCVATNLFTGELRQMRRIPNMRVKVPREGLLWSDLAELKIKSYVEKQYRLFVSATAVHEAACSVGDRCAYNPVRDVLDAVPVWDGNERLATFFPRHFGCVDGDYIRDVGRKFFAAAIKRVYEPGCKFDSMLVLEGDEGIGKSTLGKVLSYGWFTDEMSFGFDSKEVVERTRGSWIVEVPEMVTRSNADAEHVKQFITRQVERVRLSYARNAADFPRQFVMVGTTNDADYLRTTSGNRRFWCVRGDGRTIDMQAVAAERDQLWAEAKVLYALEESLYLEGDALTQARAIQADRVLKDDWEGIISSWLEQKIRVGHWDRTAADHGDFDSEAGWVTRDRVCAAEVWAECLKGPVERLNRATSIRIYNVMRRLPGWKEHGSVKFGKRYGHTRGFMREPGV